MSHCIVVSGACGPFMPTLQNTTRLGWRLTLDNNLPHCLKIDLPILMWSTSEGVVHIEVSGVVNSDGCHREPVVRPILMWSTSEGVVHIEVSGVVKSDGCHREPVVRPILMWRTSEGVGHIEVSGVASSDRCLREPVVRIDFVLNWSWSRPRRLFRDLHISFELSQPLQTTVGNARPNSAVCSSLPCFLNSLCHYAEIRQTGRYAFVDCFLAVEDSSIRVLDSSLTQPD
jgi:hypothetical protein